MRISISRLIALTALAGFMLGSVGSATAQSPGEILRKHAESGQIAEAVKVLAAASQRESASAEARMALGFAQFAQAIERMGQSFYRHGLAPTHSQFMPMLRLPVPMNPNPEKLDYTKLRQIYATFLDDLATVDRTLAGLPVGESKIVLDLFAVRLDLVGKRQAGGGERLGDILAILGMGQQPGRRPPGPASALPTTDWIVAFDRADALWLRGYTRVLAAFCEFILAHDWRETFDATGHLFFKGAVDPASALQAPLDMSSGMMGGPESRNIADMIAFVHLARWQVAEPNRMKEVRKHLKAVVALSRETWKEILAETDDDREWVPSPRQQSTAVTSMRVGEEQVKGWMHVLDEFDAVLDGRKLIPHWRLPQGIDLRQFFEEPRTFDVVLWLTGHGARPFMKPGPMVTQETWAQWQRVFGGNFIAFAVWFN